MSWLTDPIQIAPWIIYLVASGCATFGFVLSGMLRAGAAEDIAADDRWSDYP